ncbi:MAG: hypothetical protein AB7J86_31240 [Vulcanimicrobiota bacterium]
MATSRPVQTTAPRPAPTPSPAPSPAPVVSNQTTLSGEALRSEGGQSPNLMKSALFSTYSEPVSDTSSSTSGTGSSNTNTNGSLSGETGQLSGSSSSGQSGQLSDSSRLSSGQSNQTLSSQDERADSGSTTPVDRTNSNSSGSVSQNGSSNSTQSTSQTATQKTELTTDPLGQKAPVSEQVKEQAASAVKKPETETARKPLVQEVAKEASQDEAPRTETGPKIASAPQAERRRTFGGRQKERPASPPQNRPRPPAEELVGATRLQNELLAYFRPGQIHQSTAISRVDKKSDGSQVMVRADGVKIHQDKDGSILSVRSSKGKSIQRGEDDPTRATIHQERGELYQRESTGAWVDSEGNRLFGQLKDDEGVIRLSGHCGKDTIEGQRKDGVRFRRDSYGTDTWGYAGGVQVQRATGGDMFTYHADGSTTRTTSDGRGYHRNNTEGRVKVLDANQRGYDQDGTHFYTVRNGEGMLLEPNGESYERQSVRPDEAI